MTDNEQDHINLMELGVAYETAKKDLKEANQQLTKAKKDVYTAEYGIAECQCYLTDAHYKLTNYVLNNYSFKNTKEEE